jgi:hypothetical protein
VRQPPRLRLFDQCERLVESFEDGPRLDVRPSVVDEHGEAANAIRFAAAGHRLGPAKRLSQSSK